ncbi:agmatinase [Coxiella endosymbiont of Amblyomma americanum]|uniref:agmatinase n=1 Tax=Coxiella endosymbiont of Amblyomma americanum TaxID=325775 RepID=UPI00057F4304|nr:agmatinase [Coxiella endosymbiont of Amblyomma americanum]AJC50333.1 agmatinase [Coxiella endosymbiont of Amblyomma americanum]AUJ59027.1 agmatinase [Coxiella-like endosymbiont of Amblyomma americanum]
MKCLVPKKAFLGLDPKNAVDYKNAQAVIIPFGLEQSVSYRKGTANGPTAIIQASHKVELFDEVLWCEPYRNIGIVTLEEPKIVGDIPTALNKLEKLVSRVVKDKKFPFVFGGEHSITAGSIRPFVKKYDSLAILHFDAHADLRDGYHGEHFSHASAIRRCLDYHNIEVVSIGIRNISVEEARFFEANKNRIRIYWAKDKKNWNIKEIVSSLENRPVYLTFDVDGLDVSLMPATGTPEPGGLFWDDTLEIIAEANSISTIVGADINELAPIIAFHGCDFLLAKLAYKILSMIFFKTDFYRTICNV